MDTNIDAKKGAVILTAIKAADRAADTAIKRADALADVVIAQLAWTPVATEVDDVIKVVRKIVSDAKYSGRQLYNLYSDLRKSLYIRSAPNQRIEVAPAKGKTKGKHGPVKTPAKLCTSAVQRNAAMKQIREAAGLTDGRAANAPPTKAPQAPDDVVEWALAHPDYLEGLRLSFAARGYTLATTKIKRIIRKKAA